MRRVESLLSSLSRIASLTALLMSSRSIFVSFGYQGPDLGCSHGENNSVPEPFSQRFGGRLRLFRLRHVTAIRQHHEFRAGKAARHLPRERLREGVVLVSGQT